MINNLSTLMGARLVNISDVHEATGIARTTLSNIYYRRAKGVKYETLRKLCDYLNVPLHELVDYDPRDKEAK